MAGDAQGRTSTSGTPTGPGRGPDTALQGLDALETTAAPRRPVAATAWAATWPKVVAIGLVLLVWQAVVWSGWRPEYLLPGPVETLGRLVELAQTSLYWGAIGSTLQRGVVGFLVAIAVGLLVGTAVARVPVLRAAIGSIITGLQTMPSIAWFPLAVLLFQLSEQAIYFVIVLGAAPSIANGVISGLDYVPPLLLRAGRTMGASGLQLYRHVALPAALPAVVSGLKQGWAFAWRSLLAGELLGVITAGRPSLGVLLDQSRLNIDSAGLLAVMITILVIGSLVDVLFSAADRRFRDRRGLSPTA
jgi:NitT/TauT family transport system permease protein